MTDEPSPHPEASDLAVFWEESVARFGVGLPRHPAAVRVHSHIPSAMRRPRHVQIEDTGPPDADGWVTLSVQLQTEEEACSYILRFGPLIEVLEPQALRRKITGSAESVVVLYTDR